MAEVKLARSKSCMQLLKPVLMPSNFSITPTRQLPFGQTIQIFG
jgi:hypothetical protein